MALTPEQIEEQEDDIAEGVASVDYKANGDRAIQYSDPEKRLRVLDRLTRRKTAPTLCGFANCGKGY